MTDLIATIASLLEVNYSISLANEKLSVLVAHQYYDTLKIITVIYK